MKAPTFFGIKWVDRLITLITPIATIASILGALQSFGFFPNSNDLLRGSLPIPIWLVFCFVAVLPIIIYTSTHMAAQRLLREGTLQHKDLHTKDLETTSALYEDEELYRFRLERYESIESGILGILKGGNKYTARSLSGKLSSPRDEVSEVEVYRALHALGELVESHPVYDDFYQLARSKKD